MSEAIMAYKNSEWKIVSNKTKAKSKGWKLAKVYSYVWKHYWWIKDWELFEGEALKEPVNGSILIKGNSRNLKKGCPKFEELVNISLIKEENYER